MDSRNIKIDVYDRDVCVCMFNNDEEVKSYVRDHLGVDTEGQEIDAYAANDGKQFYLLFNREIVNLNHMSHETMHIVHWILDDAGIPLTDDTQEAYCYLMGFLFSKVHGSVGDMKS